MSECQVGDFDCSTPTKLDKFVRLTSDVLYQLENYKSKAPELEFNESVFSRLEKVVFIVFYLLIPFTTPWLQMFGYSGLPFIENALLGILISLCGLILGAGIYALVGYIVADNNDSKVRNSNDSRLYYSNRELFDVRMGNFGKFLINPISKTIPYLKYFKDMNDYKQKNNKIAQKIVRCNKILDDLNGPFAFEMYNEMNEEMFLKILHK